MNILYCGDRNVEKGIMMSAISLGMQTKEPLHVYLLTMDYQSKDKNYEMISLACVEKLEDRLNRFHKESFVKRIILPEQMKKLIGGVNLQTRFTPFCMLRLFADLLEELPDKILYLDADVICRKNPMELYDMDITSYEIAGVLDYYGSWVFRKKWYRRDYINSGVLLLNLKMIREDKMFAKCRDLCQNKKMFLPDQSAINKAAKKKKLLPRQYNEQSKLKDNTCFLHFTTTFRFFPWIHTVTVKPWEIDRVHKILGIYECDRLYEMTENI